jgi:hypothetical protein
MSYQKIVDLIKRIRSATSDGDIAWHETERDGVFQASFSNYSTRISKGNSYHDEGVEQYFLSILNDDGDTIEKVGDEDGRDEKERALLYGVMKEIYDTARRQSMGVDKAIDEILREIGDELPF